MATRIKVPVQVLQDNAQKLESYAAENEDIFDRIYNSIESLEGNKEWKGQAQSAAVNAAKQNKNKFRSLVNDLNALSGFMSEFSKSMSEKDNEIKSKIK